MTQQAESVVTQERFGTGMTWSEWMSHIQRNVEKFQSNYDDTTLAEADIKALRDLSDRPDGPARVLVLGEDWCPDVFRGAPVIARMAEAAGWNLRLFPRDSNPDIMSEFLNQGKHQSIPTVVFYTRDHRYISHWIERPAKANAELGQIQEQFAGLDREKDRQEMRRRYDEFQRGAVWAGWRDATVKEILQLLVSELS
jgi:hypothetical protein